MTAAERRIKSTRSLCPECLQPLEADVIEREGRIWLEKSCRDHGAFSVLLSSKAELYFSETPHLSGASCCGGSAPSGRDAPHWENHSCTVLIEITERCNLSCPTCFAGSSPARSGMMSLDTFRRRVGELVAGGKRSADMIQLSGGEPTLHPEIEAMLDLLFSAGFRKVTINSNGIRLAQAPFVDRLAACMNRHPGAELFVYLQYDGFDDRTHHMLRGRATLLPFKQRALELCLERGIHVHPVMTLTRGINDHEVGRFVSIAAGNDRIRHVVIQPAMYSGRYENARRADRLTLADAADLVVEQFGTFQTRDFGPIPCANPNCHSVAVALRTAGGLIPVSRYFPRIGQWNDSETFSLIDQLANSINGPRGFDTALRWITTDRKGATPADIDDETLDCLLDAIAATQRSGEPLWDRLLTVSIKPFMDALSYDQDRIDQCCVHILDAQGQPVSLCQFNALNRDRSLSGEAHGTKAL